LRDLDAKHLIETRDVKLIKEIFEKYPTKVEKLEEHFSEKFKLKCRSYRIYSEAYFEEIIIEYQIERRCTKYFRDHFLREIDQVKKVLEMYVKNDYLNNFLRLQNTLPHSYFVELFALCLRNDSFKIGMQIYFRQIRVQDID
jgi:hypothetical protein